MTFMEDRFSKYQEKKARKNNGKESWIEKVTDSTCESNTKTTELSNMIYSLFTNLYKDTIKESSRKNVIEYMWSKKTRAVHLAQVFNGRYDKMKFVIFCFWRLNNPTKRIFDAMVYVYYHGMTDYIESYDSFLFDWHEIIRFTWAQPNGRRLMELIGYGKPKAGKREVAVPADQKLKSL